MTEKQPDTGRRCAFSPAIIEEFCQLCHRVHEVWITRRVIFDDNPDAKVLKQSKHEPFLTRLDDITLEYTLLQLVKLHDPAVQHKSNTLGLAYMIEFGGWDEETRKKLKTLHARLDALLGKLLKPPRNKLLCHNDLATILDRPVLGEFTKDADIEYFDVLKEFIAVVQGSPFEFGAFPKNDALIFVNALVKDARAERRGK